MSNDDKPTIQIAENNDSRVWRRTRIRLWTELFSLMTVFAILGMTLFSITNDNIPLFGNFSVTITDSHVFYQYSGWIWIALAVACFFLMIVPSKAEQFTTWITESNSKTHGYFLAIFLPIVVPALSVTAFIGLADVSGRLPNTTWRSIAIVASMLVLLASMVIVYIYMFQRKHK